ncbi:Diaminopropionate ammonia-lyase [bioreactor metagenome]|uniref:Diaminopropionate ammonia-lyase n=1 Tax=bioreactor metagenome TaxID=1076179 RepID=A0A644Y469_9ZZZZ
MTGGEIKAVCKSRPTAPFDNRFCVTKAKKAAAFHQSFSEYAVTPLVSLQNLAKNLGIRGFYVKDESFRFGLNAFKVLGGSYAMGCVMAARLGLDIGEVTIDRLKSLEARERIGELTFVTATDGNHGRGVAWAASRLGHKSVVYMPKGSSIERLQNIRALGAEASITDLNYDDAVRLAKGKADENGWIFLQDTAFAGYEEIPAFIMQGYETMALEISHQLKDVRPTHIFLQAGVGAMAGAVTGFFADFYGADLPIVTIVEPDRADCIFKTAKASDGALHKVGGDLDTIMAGLACGEPCSLGWRVLDAYAENFLSVPDFIAAKGMRVLGNPVGDDARIISGESGAVTAGLVAEVLQKEGLKELREKLGLTGDSIVLCISTEGDTDRENYRRIVWDGLYPSV